MINKKIIVSVVIVVLIGIAAAGYQITTNAPRLWQPTDLKGLNPSDGDKTGSSSGQGQSGTGGTGTSSGQGQIGAGGSNMEISSSEAKSIAQDFIAEPGAVAGTPKLVKMNDTLTYVVPVIMNGETVGEIYIDPETGKNVGGAGGAP